MAVQKRRRSKARTGMRRSQWKLRPLTLVRCRQCHTYTVPHRVCPNCGYYGGRRVVAVEEAEEKKS
ncbi:MAG: 50S ribosomal protein L32 [Armatimonadota bacterium]|nr:50S ribosomal protein L32 [Armatimonadota bacterium]MDR5703577.1 50S ribosomal protein L32 [Armatimonadota bacterium]MDR7435155.1 50S ribosomal protein L32 [Armatimonadota bacterium]